MWVFYFVVTISLQGMRKIREKIAVHYVHYFCILGEWRS
jgi:hypothetical protein